MFRSPLQPIGYLFSLQKIICVSCFAFLFNLLFLSTTFGNIYTVTNLNNTGSGSLRGCLVIANFVQGIDTIKFDVEGTIYLQSELLITEGVFIDGTSSPTYNYALTPRVTLNWYAGSIIKAQNLSNLTIKGLKIMSNYPSFPKDGIELYNCKAVVIEKNNISNKRNAIVGNNITDIKIINNDLRSSGLYFSSGLSAAIYLNNLTANNLIGGVYISGNKFGYLNPTNTSPKIARLLYLEKAKNITISTSGGNINITNGMNVENPIYLKDIENLQVSYLNLSANTVPSTIEDSRSCGINIIDSKNIILNYLTIRNRNNGIIAQNCTDISIQYNDLRDSGFDLGNLAIDGAAINLNTIHSKNIIGGLYINGNRYGNYLHDVQNIFRITKANNIKIDTRRSYYNNNTNIIIDRGGLGATSPFILREINNLSISNIDVTADQNSIFEGIAFDIADSENISIVRTSARKRLASVQAINVRDIQILNNDFRDAGVGFFIGGAAIILKNISSNTLRGGVFMSENDFGSYQLSPPTTILWIRNAEYISISSQKVDNPNIIMNNSGLDTEHPLMFDNIANLFIKKIDLSTSQVGGVSISINNSQNIEINKIKARGRNISVNASHITDISIVSNDFVDSGFMSNDNGVFPAIKLYNVEQKRLDGGLFIADNKFGKNNLNPQRILEITNAEKVIISDPINSSGANVILNESGLNLDYPIGLHSINEFLEVRYLNFFADNHQNSMALQIHKVDKSFLHQMNFINWENAIELKETNNAEVYCNNFMKNNIGVKLINAEAFLKENNFESNNYAIDASQGVAFAEHNYWGASDGSITYGGSGDAFLGNVKETEFLQQPSKCQKGEVKNTPYSTTTQQKNKMAVRSLEKVEIKAFPNPTSSKFTLQIDNMGYQEKVQIRIIDVLGRELHQEEHYNQRNNLSISIDLKKQKTGVYFIEIFTTTKRIIKVVKE
ncbi:T9SS type A sorting domain-containing protein [Bernardetia sp. MNP-M8]|uniref:T9SS type A sorting domain-containing protein n=1 Tax=Bernardetia sp. MNP-M8 TaxID=3127470 RepID=UPI0030D2A18E